MHVFLLISNVVSFFSTFEIQKEVYVYVYVVDYHDDNDGGDDNDMVIMMRMMIMIMVITMIMTMMMMMFMIMMFFKVSKKGETVAYEELFRSMNIYLIDLVTAGIVRSLLQLLLSSSCCPLHFFSFSLSLFLFFSFSLFLFFSFSFLFN